MDNSSIDPLNEQIVNKQLQQSVNCSLDSLQPQDSFNQQNENSLVSASVEQRDHCYKQVSQAKQTTVKNNSSNQLLKKQQSSVLKDKMTGETSKVIITTSIKPQILINNYKAKKINLEKHEQGDTKIQLELPFHIDTGKCLNKSAISCIYYTSIKDRFIQQDTLGLLTQVKQELQKVSRTNGIQSSQTKTIQKSLVLDQTFTQVYHHLVSTETHRQNLTSPPTFTEVTSQLKCKIINLAENQQIDRQYINRYLYMLTQFYNHKHSLISKNILCSGAKKRQHQKLRLAYFKLHCHQQKQSHIIKSIVESLKNQNRLQSNINESREQKVIIDQMIKSIIDCMKDKNSHRRNKAFNILQKSLSISHTLITLQVIQKLQEIKNNQLTADYTLSLLQKCLFIVQKQFKFQSILKQSSDKHTELLKKKQMIDQALSDQKNGTRKRNLFNQKKSKTQKKVSQAITESELNQLFTRHFIFDFQFSKTQNHSLNSKLSSYSDFIFNSFEKASQNKDSSLQKMEKEPQFLYVINEFHNGHTIKQLILRNWQGLQNPQFIMKIVRKLFWLHFQQSSFGFFNHIPTLQNIIVDNNIKRPDININMTSMLSSSFLFKEQAGNIDRGNIQELIPFIWEEQLQTKTSQNQKLRVVSNLNRIKHFLSIVLFIVCRRMGPFQSYDSFFLKLIQCVQKQDQTKESNKKNSSKQKIQVMKENQNQNQPNEQNKAKNQKVLRDDLDSSISVLNPNQKEKKINKEHIYSILKYIPQMYGQFLKKNKLPQKDVKNFHMISLENSNSSRINEFQKHLKVKQNALYDLFVKIFTKNPSQMKRLTWRQVFSLLFLKGDERPIMESRLLNYLCKLYDYPLKQQDQINWIPTELYFALRYDINFCYFAEVFDGSWFQCFSLKSASPLRYNMEVMCLLKNIKSQAVKKATKIIQKLIELSLNEINDESLKDKNKRQKQNLCQKVKVAIGLLRYLNEYEKKVNTKKPFTKDQMIDGILNRDKREKTKDEKSNDLASNNCEYLTEDYIQGSLEEEVNTLENILQQFQEADNIPLPQNIQKLKSHHQLSQDQTMV